jgi:hypothetical protein
MLQSAFQVRPSQPSSYIRADNNQNLETEFRTVINTSSYHCEILILAGI